MHLLLVVVSLLLCWVLYRLARQHDRTNAPHMAPSVSVPLLRTACEKVIRIAPTSTAPLRVDAPVTPTLPSDLKQKVDELRSLICEGKAGWDSGAQLQADAHLDDLTLVRFIQAAPSAGTSAIVMFMSAMTWRAERGVGSLFAEFHPAALREAVISHRQEAVLAHFYAGVGGIARDGTPFFVERLGRADFEEYAREAHTLQLMQQAYVAQLEMIYRTVRTVSAAAGRLLHGVVIVDLSGLSLWALRKGMPVVRYAASTGLAYFPEGTMSVMVVNAPSVVALMW
jgi:hypothetical protein